MLVKIKIINAEPHQWYFPLLEEEVFAEIDDEDYSNAIVRWGYLPSKLHIPILTNKDWKKPMKPHELTDGYPLTFGIIQQMLTLLKP